MNGWKDAQNNEVVGAGDCSGYENVSSFLLKRRIQPPSPMFDRYPKAAGALKVYPITTPDKDEPMVSET